jgi:UDP-N-acetylmuramoyl-L-alanyl-D-glutamate--2,6-diaminopimelate ligase
VDRRQAIEYAAGLARKGDILVLAGKGHETYEIRKNERLPFDERTILTEAIEKKRRKRSEQ